MRNRYSFKNLYTIALLFIFAGSLLFADDDKTTKKTEEPKMNVKVGGRVFGDWMWANADDVLESTKGEIISGNEWRAVWLELAGTYGKDITFKVFYDLSQGETTAKDVWISFNYLSFGQLRVGHMKEPFSLEQMVSGKNTVFMERSLANALAPGRNTGLAILGNSSDKGISWSAGVFTEADNLGQAKAHDNYYGFSSRVTYLPWKQESSLLHLGAAWNTRKSKKGNRNRFSSRPEAHLVYKMANTGLMEADSINMLGLEFAAMKGRFLFQGEYIGAYLDSPALNDPGFSGFYLLASYLLTEDKHSYKKSNGTIGGVSPSNPFGMEDGMGAWEMAVRFSQVELDDSLISGGLLKDVTLGVNWYMNKYTRMMVNYIHADRDDFGTAGIFQMRYQISF